MTNPDRHSVGQPNTTDSTTPPPVGQRGRFRAARPPALAPKPKPVTSQTEANPEDTAPDHSALAEAPTARAKVAAGSRAGEVASGKEQAATGSQEETSDAQVVRAGGSMAIATLISRITGFLRTVLIGSALGPAVASAFNTANTLPNLITELVLGAVLTALVVPVLVRAEKEDPDKGEAFIRRLLTLTFSLTIVVTILSILLTPLLIQINLDKDGHVNVQMATMFGYLVLPQIFFYAMFAVFMAILNTKEIFKPGAWAPVVNNVVTLAVLSLYLLLPQESKLKPTDTVTITDPHVLLLGLGTTLGVVAQAVIMVPFLRKAGINLRPLWGIDERLKSFGGMATAIVVYVAISQLGFNLNNRIASQASEAAPTVYMQAWQLLQVPYGVIGVTLLTAVMPRLSRNAADGDDKAVVRDLTVASKLTMLALIPVIVFFTAFGTLIAAALFAYGSYDLATANVLGWTISFSAFTLIPYALVLLHLRVFYAREEVWTPTFIIAGITTTKLALAYTAPMIATEPRLVVVLLGAANGMGFLAGAIIGDRLLRRSLGDLQFRTVLRTSAWALGASIVGALVAWRVDALLVHFVFPHAGHPWFLIRMFIIGVLFLAVTGLVLSRSRLPEMDVLLGALARVPGLSRFVSRRQPDSVSQNMADVPQQVSQAAAMEVTSGHLMMPVLPPLSAGRVRGPRLVPGAPVCNGRYRLLADHGGSAAARLWQARELATGDVVGLTIMDPSVIGGHEGRDKEATARIRTVPAMASARAHILERARALQELQSPGMARIRAVVEGDFLVVVIADWVQGSPLEAVAQSGPDPLAAGFAVANLADAAADAAEAGATLGLDHRDRVRISTEGTAVMAFPGALPENSEAQDRHGVAATLGLLLNSVDSESVPAEVGEELQQLRALASVPEAEVDLREFARTLRAVTTGELLIDEDATPEPTVLPGFGAQQGGAGNLMRAGAVGVVSVGVVVALVLLAVSVLGGDRPDSPVSQDSLRDGAQQAVGAAPAPLALSEAVEWMPRGGRGTLDAPDKAALVVDGKDSTAWESDSYLAQLGPEPSATKEGIGLLVTLPEDTVLSRVSLTGLRPGTTVQLRSAQGQPKDLSATTLLATVTASSDKASVNLRSSGADGATSAAEGSPGPALPSTSGATSTPDATNGAGLPLGSPLNAEGGQAEVEDAADDTSGNRLLLWITKLPMPRAATVAEVSATGTWPGQPSQQPIDATGGSAVPNPARPAPTAPAAQQWAPSRPEE